MEEIWKPCKRNSKYEVSNLGRIRNDTKKILTRKPNISGYIRCYIGSNITVSLHILVAEVFVPKIDPSKTIVNHIDGIRYNNTSTNLEWVTVKENNMRKVFPCRSPKRPTSEDLDGEIWSNSSYNGNDVAVSNLGRILLKFGCKTYGSAGSDKYLRVTFCNKKSVLIHRIICTAFHGPPPTNKHVVNHIDENRQNNKPENLEWVTQKQNILHSAPKRLGIPAHNKRKIVQVSLDGELVQIFNSVSEASLKTNINRTGIQQFLINKRGLSHCGGFIWKFAD